jgi:aldehyde dehydrogenase (NAD+)
VFTVASVETAIEHIVSRPSPLALYVFSASDATVDAVVNGTCSGGVCVNDVILHMLNETLPFGGCGDSGMGSYHGLYGFDAFSHLRTVMTVENGKPAPAGRYPPFAP